jgi:hypothetical protein
MERLSRKKEAEGKRRSPAGANELEVTRFVGSIELVSDDRMAAVGQMHANLVRAPCGGQSPHKAELSNPELLTGETALDAEFSSRRRAIDMGALFQVNARWLSGTLTEEGNIDSELVLLWPAPNDREVFFLDRSACHEPVQMAGCRPIFRDEGQAARFPIQPVND